MFDDRLGVSITKADGTVRRWGPDEALAQNIVQGLTFGTTIPGGFKDCSLSLARTLTQTYPDLNLFDTIRVYGTGGQTAWEGRMVQFPGQHDNTFAIQPAAVGWSAHLQDDPSFREIYVDRDLTKWGGPSTQEQISLLATSSAGNIGGPAVTPDPTSGSPAVLTGFNENGGWSATTLPFMEAWYDAHGVALGSLYYAWEKNANVDATNTGWHWATFLLAGGDQTAAHDSSPELRAAGPGTGTITASDTSRIFAAVRFNFGAAGGSPGSQRDFGIYWTVLGVYGNHGLTKQGTADATHAQGFYASDVIANIIGRAAPLLTYTTGSGGTISPTSFVIPHLVFDTPVDAATAVQTANAFHNYDWAVWENKTFYWQPTAQNTVWRARLSQGAQVSLEGDDANNVFNGVFVTYTDPSGRTKTAGPPGSVADDTDPSLQDTTATNPVNTHGIPRRWGRLDLTQTTTKEGAIQIGAVWLQEHSLPSRRGQITLTGLVEHPTKGKRPVWEVRAGDYVQIIDRPGDVPRKVIETRYTHDGRQNVLTLDNTALKVDALLERIGVGLVGVL